MTATVLKPCEFLALRIRASLYPARNPVAINRPFRGYGPRFEFFRSTGTPEPEPGKYLDIASQRPTLEDNPVKIVWEFVQRWDQASLANLFIINTFTITTCPSILWQQTSLKS